MLWPAWRGEFAWRMGRSRKAAGGYHCISPRAARRSLTCFFTPVTGGRGGIDYPLITRRIRQPDGRLTSQGTSPGTSAPVKGASVKKGASVNVRLINLGPGRCQAVSRGLPFEFSPFEFMAPAGDADVFAEFSGGHADFPALGTAFPAVKRIALHRPQPRPRRHQTGVYHRHDSLSIQRGFDKRGF